MTDNLFEKVRQWKSGPFVIWVFILSIAAFAIGIVLFREDTITSRLGYEALEVHYGFQPRVYPITYWAMSLAPQIAQIMFAYVWLTDPRKHWWALPVVIGFFILDFISDVYHTTGNLPAATERAGVGMSLTFIFFNIGSELFITWGIGLFLTTLPEAIIELKKFVAKVRGASLGTPRREPSRGNNSSRGQGSSQAIQQSLQSMMDRHDA